MLRSLFEDIGYAARQFRKELAVSLVLVATVALGIGVNTAIFGILNGFLRPLPVRDPDQVVVIAGQVKGDETGTQFALSFPALEDYRAQTPDFDDVFGFYAALAGFSDGGKSSQFMYSAVTGNFFTALGVQPLRGRLFAPLEGEAPGTELSVVLGYSFWQRRFGGDTTVVGRVVRFDGRPATVIGITPQNFHGLYAGADMDGYLPLNYLISANSAWRKEFFTDRAIRILTTFARLKSGVDLAQAQVSATATAQRIATQHVATDAGSNVRLIPEQRARPVPISSLADRIPTIRFFVLLLGGLVLVVASLNVANIQLVRATVRERELAIRAALGSGPGRLMRQMFSESMFIVLLGTGVGLLLGNWTANIVASSLDLATDMPTMLDFGFDWRVFVYVSVIAAVAGGLIGLVPALRAAKVSVATLHDGSRGQSAGRHRQRARSALVIGQVAGSLMLLIVAGIFVRSLRNAERMDLGFTPANVLNARINPQWAGYSELRTNEFFKELGRRVRAWPDVQSASFAFSVPLSYINASMTVRLEGTVETADARPPQVGANFIDGPYFETMRIPIASGRPLRDSDDEHAPLVAVVNQTMAARFWPNQNPIGKRFFTGIEQRGPWEVVGVAGDSKYLVVFEKPLPHFYIPVKQDFVSLRVLQIRSSTPPASLSARLEREVQAMDPEIAINDLQTMARSLNGAQGFLIFRIGAFQAGFMGVLGLVLALVGVYGVVSYSATQRTREIGIRMALGGTPGSIRALFLKQGLRFVAGGVAAGLIGAIGLSRILRRFLLLASADDPLTFIAVPALLAFVAMCACYLPARRATRVDPMLVLRQD